jgi:flagellar basal body rod protein FlgC
MFDVGAGTNEMDALRFAADGMSAQRSLLDIAARNVAAAQASTPGHPYSRLVAQLTTDPDRGADAAPDPDFAADSGADGPVISSVRSEAGTGDALTEMIAVLDAQRAYEQNASIFDTAKRLAERTLDIGRS